MFVEPFKWISVNFTDFFRVVPGIANVHLKSNYRYNMYSDVFFPMNSAFRWLIHISSHMAIIYICCRLQLCVGKCGLFCCEGQMHGDLFACDCVLFYDFIF